MKRAWLRCLCILCAVSVSFSQFSFAETAPPPYKAKTVDECIQEKECVWYAFGRALGLMTRDGKPRAQQKVFKRVAPLKINNSQSEFDPGIDNFVKIISPLFPYNVEKAYLSHVGSADMARQLDVRIEYIPIFPELNGPSECSIAQIINPNDMSIYSSHSFVFINGTKERECLYMSLFNSLGFTGLLDMLPFSIFSEDFEEFTRLDLFLIFFLYQMEFENENSIWYKKNIFDKHFDDFLKKFISFESGRE